MPLLPSALPPKGEARRFDAYHFLNLTALPLGEGLVSGIPLSPHLLLDRKRKRFLAFARNDDTGNDRASGARVLSQTVYLRRSSPLFFIPLLPYPPLRGTFPSRGRLGVGESGVLISPPSPMGKAACALYRHSQAYPFARASKRGAGCILRLLARYFPVVNPLYWYF